jgi:hypothetical protein
MARIDELWGGGDMAAADVGRRPDPLPSGRP